jgi:methylase of polypeptide subunit release factors
VPPPEPVPFAVRGEPAVWRTESGEPQPSRVSEVDDRLTAAAAMGRIRSGEWLLYTGDYRNARQLLGAMARRLRKRRDGPARTPLEVFRAEREAREHEQRTLSHLLVSLDPAYQLELRSAPDVAAACREAWGEPPAQRTALPLKLLLGVLGAAEWRRKGLEVPGLKGRLHPHYGVFTPTRSEYVGLLLEAPAPEGLRVFDIGTGTGVLAFVLLQRGAASAVGTDAEPRAVASAREDAGQLRLSDRFEAVETDLFPPGRADLVVCNPPWLPELPRTRLDRAVFDPDSRLLRAFIAGLPERLNPGGHGYLLLSDFAERLGLRPSGFLEERFGEAGLRVALTKSTGAAHPRSKDPEDPLHAVRSSEQVTLYALASGAAPP